jgi:hypothetical protein
MRVIESLLSPVLLRKEKGERGGGGVVVEPVLVPKNIADSDVRK